MKNLIEQFREILPETCILTGDALRGRSGGWEHSGPIQAQALIRPRTTEEVAAVFRLCHAAGQRVVTHGGLTGLVGGAHATIDDVVLSLELMNAIEQIDPVGRTATVQAGVMLQKVQESVEKAGLLFALDLGARGSCTIGGNVATNAGGNHVIRYGMTRDLVLGLEVVLADGATVPMMNTMIKNNAGYDLKHLFIGSEGTLGVVTRAVLRLRERPRSHNTALIAVNRFDDILSLLKTMDAALGGSLAAFEVMWQEYYQFVTTPPVSNKPPLHQGYPFYLIVESHGGHPEADRASFEAALEQAVAAELIADAVVAQTRAERAAIWDIRDSVSEAQRFEPLFIFDISLALREMHSYVEEVHAALRAAWPQIRCFTFGHLGDGNLHFMISTGESEEQSRCRVEEIVYKPLVARHGSISAEHGIGLEKKAYLPWCRSAAEIDMMRALKKTFDPKGILNPGRIF
ncbi:FAD-binding oxidoreductase [candidate division KSB1 bacterium]|nr:FAD-binding oxidoreductase [candidate division KSB1 bacterium]